MSKRCHYGPKHEAEYTTVTAGGIETPVCGAHLVQTNLLLLTVHLNRHDLSNPLSLYCVRCGSKRQAADQGHVWLCNWCCETTLVPPHTFCGTCGRARNAAGMCRYCESEATL